MDINFRTTPEEHASVKNKHIENLTAYNQSQLKHWEETLRSEKNKESLDTDKIHRAEQMINRYSALLHQRPVHHE